jgi:hypothetical protein
LITLILAFVSLSLSLSAEELERLQHELSSFKALKLQDVAHVRRCAHCIGVRLCLVVLGLVAHLPLCLCSFSQYTLDIARELLLALEDELEHYADPAGPFTHDGYRIIQKLVPPKLQEKDEKKAKAGKKKRNAAAAAATTDVTTPDDALPAVPAIDSLLQTNAPAPAPSVDEVDWDPIALEARFANLSDQDVLLLWFNHQLQLYHYRGVPNYDEYQLPLSKRVTLPAPAVANFSTDFSTTRGVAEKALLMVLENVAPILNYQQSMNYLLHHELDADLRVKSMISILCEFNTDLGDMIGLETFLLAKAPDMVAAFVAKLFCYYPNLNMQKDG